MNIITHTCPKCHTIVAANVLEENRTMKCPGIDCQAVLRFADLSEADRKHILDHREKYQI